MPEVQIYHPLGLSIYIGGSQNELGPFLSSFRLRKILPIVRHKKEYQLVTSVANAISESK